MSAEEEAFRRTYEQSFEDDDDEPTTPERDDPEQEAFRRARRQSSSRDDDDDDGGSVTSRGRTGPDRTFETPEEEAASPAAGSESAREAARRLERMDEGELPPELQGPTDPRFLGGRFDSPAEQQREIERTEQRFREAFDDPSIELRPEDFQLEEADFGGGFVYAPTDTAVEQAQSQTRAQPVAEPTTPEPTADQLEQEAFEQARRESLDAEPAPGAGETAARVEREAFERAREESADATPAPEPPTAEEVEREAFEQAREESMDATPAPEQPEGRAAVADRTPSPDTAVEEAAEVRGEFENVFTEAEDIEAAQTPSAPGIEETEAGTPLGEAAQAAEAEFLRENPQFSEEDIRFVQEDGLVRGEITEAARAEQRQRLREQLAREAGVSESEVLVTEAGGQAQAGLTFEAQLSRLDEEIEESVGREFATGPGTSFAGAMTGPAVAGRQVDLERGVDYTVDFDDGRLTADFTRQFDREFAEEMLEAQFTEQFAVPVDFERGDVQRTEGGDFTVTESGQREITEARQTAERRDDPVILGGALKAAEAPLEDLAEGIESYEARLAPIGGETQFEEDVTKFLPRLSDAPRFAGIGIDALQFSEDFYQENIDATVASVKENDPEIIRRQIERDIEAYRAGAEVGAEVGVGAGTFAAEDPGRAALQGAGLVGGAVLGGAAIQRAPGVAKRVATRARGGVNLRFREVSQPARETRTGLPAYTDEAVDEPAIAREEFVAQAEKGALAESADDPVAFHARGASDVKEFGGFGDEFEAPEGTSELPGAFFSADLSPLRFEGGGGSGILSSLKPRLPRPRVRSGRILAEEGIDVDVMPAGARGFGYGVQVEGEVVRTGLSRAQANRLADELGGQRVTDPTTTGFQFLTEEADPEKLYVRPKGSISPEQEAIAPPGAKFVETGQRFTVRRGGEVVPGRVYQRVSQDFIDSADIDEALVKDADELAELDRRASETLAGADEGVPVAPGAPAGPAGVSESIGFETRGPTSTVRDGAGVDDDVISISEDFEVVGTGERVIRPGRGSVGRGSGRSVSDLDDAVSPSPTGGRTSPFDVPTSTAAPSGATTGSGVGTGTGTGTGTEFSDGFASGGAPSESRPIVDSSPSATAPSGGASSPVESFSPIESVGGGSPTEAITGPTTTGPTTTGITTGVTGAAVPPTTVPPITPIVPGQTPPGRPFIDLPEFNKQESEYDIDFGLFERRTAPYPENPDRVIERFEKLEEKEDFELIDDGPAINLLSDADTGVDAYLDTVEADVDGLVEDL